MIYVFEGGNVVYDGSTITEEEKTKAVAVASLPEPEQIEGKIAVLKANKATNEVYYEYIDRPKEPEIEQLKQQIADINIALANIMGV